jgi:hypothetical protein
MSKEDEMAISQKDAAIEVREVLAMVGMGLGILLSLPANPAAKAQTIDADAAKEFVCRQISTVAGEKQLPVLASLLLAQPGNAEAEVSDAARSALQLVQHPQFRWQQTEGSIALLNHQRTVWQLNYGKDAPKPYFHPLALIDGVVLTAFSPRDHPWHRGMWFSWKMLNGVNYWEEDRTTGLPDGRTEVVDAQIIPNQDCSANIFLTLTYHLPDKPPLLTEKRKIAVSAPDKEGRYWIDWESAFTAAGQDVLLKGGTAGGGYAGLGVRLSQTTKDWRLIDSEGRADLPGGPVAKNTHGQHARWMDFSVADSTTGEIGGIAIFQHLSSFRYPSHWHNVMDDTVPFGYFSPAPLWAEPYTLPAGDKLKLSYGILIHPGRGIKDQLETAWTVFSKSKE